MKLEEVKLDGSPFDAAEALAQLGNTEQAITLLDQSCDKRFSRIAFLKVDPNFDSLRSHPRFKELLRRTHLTP
ncbi:MAG: TPR end-of-group domain-containing protein [Blastocatellia bacterium]